MGFLDAMVGLLDLANEFAQKVDEESEEYYEIYKSFRPGKILLEMDKCRGDLSKTKALQKLYAEKAGKMDVGDLKKITEDAESRCTPTTYKYASQIYEKERERERNRRDPWK